MKLSETSVDRPVLATVFSLAILLAGLLSMRNLPNRELPDVDPPVVSVTTVLSGAAPEVIEASITQPLEDAIVAIEGIRHLTSVSREQVSSISVEFELSRDVDVAASDVRDRVRRVQAFLPDDSGEPIVAKRDADSSPVVWIGLSSDRHDQIELSRIADRRIRDRLSRLPGVSDIIIGGERRHSIRVWLDNRRLTAHWLTASDVADALRRENVEIPSGRIEGEEREWTVRTLGEMRTPEQFTDLVVAERNGSLIRLGDVARVEIGAEDDRKLVRFNGRPAVGIGVVRQSKANTIDVVDAVVAEMDEIRRHLPEGIELNKAFDQSVFIRRSIADVTRTIFEAVALVVLVIFLFLRSIRATVIPVVAIPVSIIGAFVALDAFGYSINTLTLMGLTLAIGLVVDDAIVVLENVSRWVESGTPPREATLRGMREISFAVVAATASVVAVFMPLVFLRDSTGRLFREFGVTVAAAVAISGFVALTLSPMLCARVLRVRKEEGVRKRLGDAITSLRNAYVGALSPTLRRPGWILAFGGVWVLAGALLYWTAEREFIPDADRGMIMAFTRAPEGSSLEYTSRYQEQVESVLLDVPEMSKVFSVIALGFGTPGAVNEGGLFATLVPWEERSRTQAEVLAEISEKTWQNPGLFAFAMSPSPLGQRFSSAPVSFVVQGPELEKVAEYADAIVQRTREVSGFVDPRSDLQINKPSLEVEIDRDRAADLDVDARQIGTTLQILLGGLDVTTFQEEGETYDVMVQLEASHRSKAEQMAGLYVHGSGGQLVPLASVAGVRTTVTPQGIAHFDRFRSATISARLAPGFALGEALERLEGIADDVLPRDGEYSWALSGDSEQFRESGNALVIAYALAVLIVYLVLAAQFESFAHPITVLVAVALSFTGALLGLRLVGHSVNLFSQIGLVMLVGLVTKNSILIVEFANQLRERGESTFDAVVHAATARFRPILMTAVSTSVGILPIALGLGAGGESRAPLGVAVIGGMAFSTLLTLFVVPAFYLLSEKGLDVLRERAGGRVAGGAEEGA